MVAIKQNGQWTKDANCFINMETLEEVWPSQGCSHVMESPVEESGGHHKLIIEGLGYDPLSLAQAKAADEIPFRLMVVQTPRGARELRNALPLDVVDTALTRMVKKRAEW